MKEAAGEANLTVVAIILIAVVVAVATPLVNSLMRTAVYRSCCTDSGMTWEGSDCFYPRGQSDLVDEFWQCTDQNNLRRRRALQKN